MSLKDFINRTQAAYGWLLSVYILLALSIVLAFAIKPNYLQNLGNIGQFISAFAILVIIASFRRSNDNENTKKTIEILKERQQLREDFLHWRVSGISDLSIDELYVSVTDFHFRMEIVCLNLKLPHKVDSVNMDSTKTGFQFIHDGCLKIMNDRYPGKPFPTLMFPNLVKFINMKDK